MNRFKPILITAVAIGALSAVGCGSEKKKPAAVEQSQSSRQAGDAARQNAEQRAQEEERARLEAQRQAEEARNARKNQSDSGSGGGGTPGEQDAVSTQKQISETVSALAPKVEEIQRALTPVLRKAGDQAVAASVYEEQIARLWACINEMKGRQMTPSAQLTSALNSLPQPSARPMAPVGAPTPGFSPPPPMPVASGYYPAPPAGAGSVADSMARIEAAGAAGSNAVQGALYGGGDATQPPAPMAPTIPMQPMTP